MLLAFDGMNYELSLLYDRRNIPEYLSRETWIVLGNILYCPSCFFIQIKFNQLKRLPAMCQITSVDLILLRCQLIKDRY